MIATLNTKTNKRVVFSGDPAINKDMSNVPNYKKSLDLAELAFSGTPTYFTIQAVGNSAYRNAVAQGMDEETDGARSLHFMFEFARNGIRKVENLKVEGDSAEFPHGMSKEVFETLPVDVCIELAEIVTRLSDVSKSEDDKKDEGK